MPNSILDDVVDSLQEYHAQFSPNPLAATKLTDYSDHPVEVKDITETNLKDLLDEQGWLVQPTFPHQPTLTIVRQGTLPFKEFQYIPNVKYLDAKGRDVSDKIIKTEAVVAESAADLGFDLVLNEMTEENIDTGIKTVIPRLRPDKFYPRYITPPSGQLLEVEVPWKLRVYFEYAGRTHIRYFDPPNLKIVYANQEAHLESSARITRVHIEPGDNNIHWTVGEPNITLPRFRLATFPFGLNDKYDHVTYYPIHRPEDYTIIGVFLRQISTVTHTKRTLYNRPNNWDDLRPVQWSEDRTWLYITHEDMRNQTEKDTDNVRYQYSIETHYRGPGKRLHLVANSFQLNLKRHEAGG